ncbi:DNA polymerase III subunit beta [Roseococcus pinisoli]|uniref:Beta sliding clamp n=1 Tax=Roseococcus pinisoli TaxID=2835040 RepID=A0ABS5QB85_9PROT|nr:DNA polymerase III subunit beta [Roseococcus pinisoli]
MSDKQSFAIQAGALRAAFARAVAVTERRNTIPILAHLHLEAKDGVLTVRATDLEIRISIEAKGDGDLPPITASAARLAALLPHIREEQTVTLTRAKGGQLELAAGTMRVQLFALEVEDFPTEAAPAWAAKWTVPAGDLRALLDRTMHAVSTEETRYYLNGIYLHPPHDDEARNLRAASTDGHRLMLAEIPLPAGDMPLAGILPRKTANILRAMLAQLPPGRPVEARQTDSRIEFQAGSWTFNSKLIDGTFPDYRRVMPADGLGEALQILDPRRMMEAIQSVSAISDERSRPIRVTNGSGLAVTLHCRQPENGEAQLDVPAEVAAWASNGAHPEFGVQARYLLDTLRVFRGGEGLTFRVEDGRAPIRVTGAEGVAVLMPMRV